MRALLALTTATLLVASLATAHAQQMTKEETLKELSSQLAKIQERLTQQTMARPASYQSAIEEAIKQASAVRDYFADNRYIKVTGFSVGIPPSISVNVDFK
jgi:hypothetical protein